MENMEQAKAKMGELENRLRERGVVDVKFFKAPEYYQRSPLEQAREICEIVENVLDGNTTPASPFGDSVRSPNMLSPVARCGGGHLGDHHEEEQASRTTAP